MGGFLVFFVQTCSLIYSGASKYCWRWMIALKSGLLASQLHPKHHMSMFLQEEAMQSFSNKMGLEKVCQHGCLFYKLRSSVVPQGSCGPSKIRTHQPARWSIWPSSSFYQFWDTAMCWWQGPQYSSQGKHLWMQEPLVHGPCIPWRIPIFLTAPSMHL